MVNETNDHNTNYQRAPRPCQYKNVEELVQEQGKSGASSAQTETRQYETIAYNTIEQWSHTQSHQRQSLSCIVNTDVEITPCMPSEQISQRGQSGPMSHPMGAQFQVTPALTSDASSGMSSNPVPLPNTHQLNPQQDQLLGNQEKLDTPAHIDFEDLMHSLDEEEERMAWQLTDQEAEIPTEAQPRSSDTTDGCLSHQQIEYQTIDLVTLQELGLITSKEASPNTLPENCNSEPGETSTDPFQALFQDLQTL